MTEHPPTYFEARNVYQRLADLLPLVGELCFVAEHGEVVSLRRIVVDAATEIYRQQRLLTLVDKREDIVTRLRFIADITAPGNALVIEAADEIVRLRAAVAQLEKHQ